LNISSPTAGLTISSKMDIYDMGLRDYRESLLQQTALLEKRIKGLVPDTLIMTEHLPVVTLGRLAGEGDIDRAFFDSRGVDILRTGRGGKNTFHGPGQLVLYPLIDLSLKKKDVSFYIDTLERAAAGALNALGVPASPGESARGVWVEGRKIAFIGIAVKKWVTYHGVAVNINNDTEPFTHMNPCGESGIRVISARECLGRRLDMAEAKSVFSRKFAEELEASYGPENAVPVRR